MASSKIKGIIVEIGGDTTKLGKALSTVEKNVKTLKSELKGVNSLLKMDPSNVDLLRQKQQILTQSISETSEKLKVLKNAQASVQEQFDKGKITAEQYRDFQREIVTTESKLKSLKEEQKSFGNVAASYIAAAGEKVTEFGGKVEDAGKKMMGVTATVGIAGTAITKSAIEWESAFTGVKKTVEGTDEQLAELEKGLLDLSKQTSSSATDIAEVAEAARSIRCKN